LDTLEPGEWLKTTSLEHVFEVVFMFAEMLNITLTLWIYAGARSGFSLSQGDLAVDSEPDGRVVQLLI
jgi:hypothetical protein